jgi:hypothetical protein
MLAGIAFQLAFIVIYVTIASEFFARWAFDRPIRAASAQEKDLSAVEGAGTPHSETTAVAIDQSLDRRLKLMVAGLAFSTTCILIRYACLAPALLLF